MSEQDEARAEQKRRAQLRIDRCQRVLRALAGRLNSDKARRAWARTLARYEAALEVCDL